MSAEEQWADILAEDIEDELERHRKRYPIVAIDYYLKHNRIDDLVHFLNRCQVPKDLPLEERIAYIKLFGATTNA